MKKRGSVKNKVAGALIPALLLGVPGVAGASSCRSRSRLKGVKSLSHESVGEKSSPEETAADPFAAFGGSGAELHSSGGGETAALAFLREEGLLDGGTEQETLHVGERKTYASSCLTSPPYGCDTTISQASCNLNYSNRWYAANDTCSQGGNNPVFTNAATANFAENGTGTVLDVNANDGDGGGADVGITYALSGGVDQAKFSINTSSGLLTFQSAPDFENPTDSGGDNVYNVQVQATDGDGSTTQDIAITVTDVVENNAPTDIALTATAIDDSATGAGADVGTLSATDADGGDTQTYSLVTDGSSANGDCGTAADHADNGSFQINGTTLEASPPGAMKSASRPTTAPPASRKASPSPSTTPPPRSPPPPTTRAPGPW